MCFHYSDNKLGDANLVYMTLNQDPGWMSSKCPMKMVSGGGNGRATRAMVPVVYTVA